MIIHVVKQGETISSIAMMYGKDKDSLIQENGLVNADNLAVGQTIVIIHAKQVHTVKEGDTLQGIADKYGISLIQLLRNNPYLLGREYIFPGETLVIHYEDDKIMKITTNGIVFPFVDQKIIEKNLLYLTYLSVYSYYVTSNGELNDIDDINIIKLAKSYGVAPIMVITNTTEAGYEDSDVVHNILINQEIRNNLIENVLSVLKSKGYYAVTINFPHIQSGDRKLFIVFTSEITERLHKEGYKVFISITPNTFELDSRISHEKVDYSIFGQTIDGVVLFHYDWAYPSDISTLMIPFYYIRDFIEFFASQMPPEKIFLGGTTIGYIWDIPYIEDVSKARVISNTNAVVLASETNSTILFNKLNLSSHFYIKNEKLSQVFFYDARAFTTFTQLIPELGLQGLSIWNVMYYLPQFFLILNTQYDIENLYNFFQEGKKEE